MKNSIVKIGNIIRRFDWWLLGGIAVLIALGLLVQYSLGANQDIPTLDRFGKQVTFVVIGVIAFVMLSVIDHRLLTLHPFIHASTALALLVAVLLFGQSLQGTTGWFIVGGFSVQPVEFVKMLLLLFIASYVHADISLMRLWKTNLVIGTITALMVILVFLQPDLGSALMLFFLWFAYVILLRAPKKFIGLVIVGVFVAFILGWFFLFADYQRDRLTTFINPEADALGAGYNITQSIVAVGSGGMWGRGLGLGTQSQLHFLPEATSDFVFAVVAEELGLFGVTLLLAALCVIVWRLVTYAKRAQDSYSFVMVIGVICYMVFQSSLVIGMNIGIFPITGVPLPLVSAGGSSMIATLLMLGLVHRIGMAVHD